MALQALLFFFYFLVHGWPEGIIACGKLQPHLCLDIWILLSQNNKLEKGSKYTQDKTLSYNCATLWASGMDAS